MSETSTPLGLQDLVLLYGESPSTMMHVGGLMPFSPPEDAPTGFLRQLIDDNKNSAATAPWNRKLSHPGLLYSPIQSWVVDDNVDLDYHVRRSALPSPGDERELGVLISRLHSHALDLTRPPWEMHVIEGLEGGRFAVYIKMHHALVDGYTGMKLMERGLSVDPDDTGHPLFFNFPSAEPVPEPDTADGSLLSRLGGLFSGVAGVVGSAAGAGRSTIEVTKAMINSQLRGDGEYHNLANSVQAPQCILNSRVSRNRRFATQQYDFQRLKSIGAKHDAKLNDVALAIVSGGLRRFLGELDELPDEPLVAFLPVNVRAKDDEGGGNSVGSILVPLATDVADPIERLDTITTSTRIAKAQLSTMSKSAIVAYSNLLLAPAVVQMASAVTGVKPPWPFTYNLCISNVVGPKEVLYLRGSRMEASYPVSIASHGMALNITMHSYADTLNFGFVGCRDALPHLQRLATYTGEALDELDNLTNPSRRRR